MSGDVESVSPADHPCELHRDHRPQPLITVKHHVQPQGMAGADDPANWAFVCDTGHRNVHTILGPMCDAARPEYGQAGRRGTAAERALAKRGFDAWVAAGKPGNPRAAYGLVVDHAHGQGSQ